MIEHGDDLRFHYGGSKYRHGWSINTDFSIRTDIDPADERDSIHVMMAKIKRDRFASLASTYREGFDVDADHRMGEELFVNVLARNGQVRVALAAKTDPYHCSLRKHEHLPGLSFDDCLPITGDHIRAPVQFKNARLTDISPDKPLTLRFELTRAEIFTYEWSDVP